MFSSSCRSRVDVEEDNLSKNLQDVNICYSGTKFRQRRFLSGHAKASIIKWLEGSGRNLEKAKHQVIKDINEHDCQERNAVRAYIMALPADPPTVVKKFLLEMAK